MLRRRKEEAQHVHFNAFHVFSSLRLVNRCHSTPEALDFGALGLKR